MVIAWRVVAIDKDGTRIVVDEGLSDERALLAAGAMLKKGYNVTIEADISPHGTGGSTRNN